MLYGWSDPGRVARKGGGGRGEGEMHTWFWWENLKDRGHLKDLDAAIEMDLGEIKLEIMVWIDVTQYGQVANCS
jgi:hypothetical protein